MTSALATQLVVSFPGALDEAGSAELAAIWAELQAFAEQIEDVPLSEIRARLTEFEQRILDVVREHAGEAPPDPATGGSPAEETPATSPDGGSGDGTGGDPASSDPAPPAEPAPSDAPADDGGGTSSGPTGATPTSSSATPEPSSSASSATTSASTPAG